RCASAATTSASARGRGRRGSSTTPTVSRTATRLAARISRSYGRGAASRKRHEPERKMACGPDRPPPPLDRGRVMIRRLKSADEECGTPAVRSLELMLDYAIIEGAELRLPMFVLLLRTARLELMMSIAARGAAADRSRRPRIKDRSGAVECRTFAEPIL